MQTLNLPSLAKPAFKPIMCRDGVIAIGQYYSTSEQGEIVFQALADFGFLIRSRGVPGVTQRFDFKEFVTLIEASYGGDIKVQEILRVLRAVHELNVSKPEAAKSSLPTDEELCAASRLYRKLITKPHSDVLKANYAS